MISALQLVELQNSDNPTYQDIATNILINDQYTGSLELANKIYRCLVEVDQNQKETKVTRLSQLKNYRAQLNSNTNVEERMEQKRYLDEIVLQNGELLDSIGCLQSVIRNGLSTLVFSKKENIQEFISFAKTNQVKQYTNMDINLLDYYKAHPAIFNNTTPNEFLNVILYCKSTLIPELQQLGYCQNMDILEFMNQYSYLFLEQVERLSGMMEFVKENDLTYLFDNSLRILCANKNQIEKKLLASKQLDQEKETTTEEMLTSSTSTLMNGSISKLEWNPYLLKQMKLPNKKIPKGLLTLNSFKLFQKITLLQETPYVEIEGKMNPATFVFEKRLSCFHMGYDTMAARILYLKSKNQPLTRDDLTCANYKWDRKYVEDNTKEIIEQYYQNQLKIQTEKQVQGTELYCLPEFDEYQNNSSKELENVMKKLDEKLHNYHQLDCYSIRGFMISRLKVQMYLSMVEGSIQEEHIQYALLSNMTLLVKDYKKLETEIMNIDFSDIVGKSHRL